MTRELNEAVVLAQNLTDNIRSPIQLPLELAKQLQECIPRGFVDSTEAALCVSEVITSNPTKLLPNIAPFSNLSPFRFPSVFHILLLNDPSTLTICFTKLAKS